MGENTCERREARRFPLALPLEFDRGRGTTCDVSAMGVFFTTATPPQRGERLRCCLRMTGATTRQLEFDASVVRIERRGNEFGVAARFDALQSELTVLADTAAKDGVLH